VSLHVVVAVKGLERGKHRLAGVLAPEDRQRLIVTMLDDVLSALRAVIESRHISVLTRDVSLVPEGVGHIDDRGFGLNAAISHAAHVVTRAGGRSMLVLPADLPFATSADMDAILRAAKQHAAVIVPDAQRTGTNALLLSPPALVQPHFGPGSFATHVAILKEAGVVPHVLDRAGLAHDVDVPADLESLMHRQPRYGFLAAALRKVS
jgi:2-phospho-L-lactate guanylyltransferase